MRTGALIVAAGMSSRMGTFKPLLPVGDVSMIQRIIDTLKEAGADPIVVITGNRADKIEAHLVGQGVIFLRNENYATTQMFDSARIGFAYLKDKCDRVLFTPVDIPLFTKDTVNALLASGAELAVPTLSSRSGHPLLLAGRLIPAILADDGEGGLKGALKRCGAPLTRIRVDDPGILRDADTPEDYAALLTMVPPSHPQ